jgi:hypothetical protein
MKKIIIILLAIIYFERLSAQSVGIGNPTPHGSAILDLTSINQGLLIPRMTGAQRAAIPSPAVGLLVIQTNTEVVPPSSPGLYLYEQVGAFFVWRRVARTDEIPVVSPTWTVNGSSQYSNVAGNVGIGINAPTSKFHLVGNLLQDNGTMTINNTNPTLIFQSGGINKGFLQAAGDDIRIATSSGNTAGKFIVRLDGIEPLVVEPGGNVGIGTASPSSKLHVVGNTRVTNGSITIDDDIGALNFFTASSNKAHLELRSSNYDFRIGTIAFNSTGKLFFETQSTTRMTIDPDGNVGIGTVVPAEKLVVAGNTLISSGGILSVAKSSGLKTVEIKPTESGADGASMLLYNNAGVATIEIDADFGDGDGRVITSELQIRGGSDLAENFDITDEEEKYLKPGMLVSIDTEKEGQLCITKQSTDTKIVGVISGANGIKPGMLMGQQGTIAYGKYPIALAGRVYVLSNKEGGEINAGDFLTSASQRGYAKKAGKLSHAQGAIIGKAMGKADSKTGYVLVLINLQ